MKKNRGFAGILESLDEARDRRLERKLPGWADRGIVVPTALALEQCSSSATASYKVRLALSRLGGRPESVCDITGGLGADSAAFAAVAGRLVYIERNPVLVEAARANFSALGLDNVEFRCEEVGPGSEIPECRLIVADPARRSESGRKLFRLEDCSPDIGALAPYLLRKAEWLMVKLSPMADISVLAARFGAALREVHVVGSGGEVRELLCLLSREVGEFRGITAVELGAREDGSDECFSFLPEEEKAAEFTAAGRLELGGILLEPRACLLKAGAFKLPCSRFGLGKLAPSTHLYMAPDGGELPPRGLFRRFVRREGGAASELGFDKGTKVQGAQGRRERPQSASVKRRTPAQDRLYARRRPACVRLLFALPRQRADHSGAGPGLNFGYYSYIIRILRSI